MNDAEERLRAFLAKSPQGLAEHVLRVVGEAVRLAGLHDVDVNAARIASLGHDIMRAHGDDRLLTIAGEQGHTVDPVERLAPILLHGPLAVPVLREQYGVVDADVLGAVAMHTTAGSRMSKLQKLIFIADKIDPEKIERRPAVAHVRDLAEQDLDAALRAYLDLHILVALEDRWPLHPNTVAARNELVAAEAASRPRPA